MTEEIIIDKKSLQAVLKRCDYLEQENKELMHYLACMTEQRNKLKTALEEIKAIAEDAYENESEYQATGVYNEIIQKINEVLNG